MSSKSSVKSPNVNIAADLKRYEPLIQPSQVVLEACVMLEKIHDARIFLYFINNKRSEMMHMKFMHKKGPANVMSFPFTSFYVGSPNQSVGEVYMTPDYIREKKENFLLLLIHGFLHLKGYTHNGISDTINMQKKEESLCGLIEKAESFSVSLIRSYFI